MPRPLLSIITATYNSEKYLPETIASVKMQTYRNIEHLFIDGYSTDCTLDLIRKYQRQVDYPVRLYRYPAQGISDAFNKGIDHARGQYAIFLNSDDFFIDSNATKRIAEHIRQFHNPYWIQAPPSLFYMESQKIIVVRLNPVLKKLFPLLLRTPLPFFSHQNAIMCVKLLKHYRFNTAFNVALDKEIIVRIIDEYPPRVVNDAFVLKRKHPEAQSATIKGIAEQFIIFGLYWLSLTPIRKYLSRYINASIKPRRSHAYEMSCP